VKQSGFWVTIAIASLAGFLCAQLVLRSIPIRDKLGETFNRGHLLALVDGRGIYEVDLSRELAENSYVAGIEEEAEADTERQAALTGLIASVGAQSHAAGERVSPGQLKRQMNLLRFQFGNEKAWNATLNSSSLSARSLAACVRENLKTREWISRQIGNQLTVTDDECREFYNSHLDQFFLAERRNVAHLFLAAPPETPAHVVETKRAAIEALSVRVAAGEDFATLVAQNSEDDATKLRGGELGYFSAKRMPPDFVEAANRLRSGQISAPIRTRLGFHILKLIDVQAAQQQAFDDVRDDIAVKLANQKREVAVEILAADLRRNASYLRPF